MRIVNNGLTPSGTPSVVIGGAQVAGVPVTLDASGASVAGSQVVTTAPLQQVVQALNAALAAAGFSLSALAPVVTNSTGEQSIDATGVTFTYAQSPVAIAPTQTVRETVGEVYADALATAPPPQVTISVPSFPGVPGIAGVPGVPGTTSLYTSASRGHPPVAAPGRPAAGRIVASKLGWLLAVYLLWQLLVIGTAASLVWWRLSMRRVLP